MILKSATSDWVFWHLETVKCQSRFSILRGGFCFILVVFKVFLIFVRDFPCSSVVGNDFMASICYWCVSLQAECFGILTFSKMKLPFLILIPRYYFFFWVGFYLTQENSNLQRFYREANKMNLGSCLKRFSGFLKKRSV